MPLAKRTWDS